MVRLVSPNTNVTAGSINTTFLKDKAVTGDKIATTGALDKQVLSYDSATDTVVWQDVSYLDNTFENGIVVGGATSIFNADVQLNGDLDLNGDIAISGTITDLAGITADTSFTLQTVGASYNITLDATGHVFAETDDFYVGSITQAAHITGTSIGAVGTALQISGDFTGDLTGDVTGTVSDISNHTTTNLTEGTNLYYTDARVQTVINSNSAGFITDYTVTEADVTQHQAALAITESQITDLTHYTDSDAISAVENETTLELSEGLTIDGDIFVGDYDLLSTTSYSSTGVQIVKPDTKAKWAAVSVVEYGGDYNNTLPFGSFHNPTFGGEIHGGTEASPTAAPDGKRAVQFNGAARYGTGASDVHTIANIVINTNESQSSTNRGGAMQFRVTPNGDSATRDFLKLSGQGSQRIDVDYDPSGHFSQTRFSTQSPDGFEFVGEVKFYDTIELDQKTAHPSNPSQGQMYFNTTDETFYGYTGTTNGWVALH